MIKKILLSMLGVLLVFVCLSVALNMFKNSPNLIRRSVEIQIEATEPESFTNYSDWLWSDGRKFSYNILYMNIFSPGTADFTIRQGVGPDAKPVYDLQASVKESDLFKKFYDAQMIISSQVLANLKVPLIYREVSITPEEKKSKQIVFSPEENIAEREGIKFKIPDKTYDPLSVFFNFLSSEFIIGEPIVLHLLSKEEIYEFRITPKELNSDIYRLEGEVHRKDRSSTHGASFTIWVLNGRVRIPLLIKVVSAAGPIYLRLQSVK